MAAAIPIPAQLLQRQCLQLEHTLILLVSKVLAAVALLAGAWVGPAAAAPLACKGPAHICKGYAATIARQLKATGKKVLTFVGYSGAGYQDPDALAREASRILDRHAPARTLINIGGTAEGVGQIYELAKEKGFETLGIVSSLARQEQVPLSPYVDTVLFVPDSTWGGELPQGMGMSPTSSAIVRSSDALVGIGGGEVARDELLAARRAGKPVTFIPADMNHQLAREKARRKGQPEPTEFGGAAAAALAAEK
jgi:predicted Rossmann-fold nucleotide-binding protein